MPSRLKRPIVLLIFQLLAFWPVWRWFASRLNDGSDDSWGLVALITALGFLVFRRPQLKSQRASLLLPSLFTLIYLGSFHLLSPLPRAVIATFALAATLSIYFDNAPWQPGLCGLLLLALPLMASLQFYLGFPLRLLIATMAAPILQLGGLPVLPEGACLNWDGRLLLIDAPCSGIKMLWTGLYLTFTLACYYRLNLKRTALAIVIALPTVILANLLRALALFYVESGILFGRGLPAWTHEGIGVAFFLLSATAVAWAIHRLSERNLCAARLSS